MRWLLFGSSTQLHPIQASPSKTHGAFDDLALLSLVSSPRTFFSSAMPAAAKGLGTADKPSFVCQECGKTYSRSVPATSFSSPVTRSPRLVHPALFQLALSLSRSLGIHYFSA